MVDVTRPLAGNTSFTTVEVQETHLTIVKVKVLGCARRLGTENKRADNSETNANKIDCLIRSNPT